MSKAKKTWIRIGAGGILFLIAWILPLEAYWDLGLFIAAYLIIGYDVLWRAARNIAHGQVFDENFLMCIATIGAFALGEYPEGVAVLLFYQVGEQFQSYAVGRSRKSIAALMDIRPDYANIMRNGQMVQVDPEEIQPGEMIYIKAGEKVPLDGIVEEGESFVDTSALTGESVPRSVKPGKEILSGSINQDGLIKVRVTKEFGESTVSKILDLVENAGSKKARAENFITRFAKYYTPVVVIAAVILAVFPPLVVPGAQWDDWIERALIFLVISCPCALVISIPLGFFGGIGGASKEGILVKGSNYLEALADMEIAVFDKTGTLTKGTFEVMGNYPANGTQEALIEEAALAENYSNHPIAASLRRAYGRPIDTERIRDVEEFSGHGVQARIDGEEILVGNAKLMRANDVLFTEAKDVGTIVYVARNKKYQGYIVIADTVKEDAAEAIRELKREGVEKTVMLTGDSREVAKQIGTQLGIDEIHSELLPGDKVEQVESLLHEASAKGKLAFVGDGMNDAPVLSRADIGIAMGGLGSDAAIEAADIVIMDDKPSKIGQAMRISKRTLRIVKQNIVFALGIKGIFLLMGALGIANMWEAVFADVGVSVIAILNAMRALRVK